MLGKSKRNMSFRKLYSRPVSQIAFTFACKLSSYSDLLAVCGLCPSSGILTKKKQRFWNWIWFRPQVMTRWHTGGSFRKSTCLSLLTWGRQHSQFPRRCVNFGKKKASNPKILSVIHHRQNPLKPNYLLNANNNPSSFAFNHVLLIFSDYVLWLID
jgi:hypothetical protein